ncbi:MAG TPA: DUF3450 family protein [Planctomycetota bacterium]|nr:DUF3450 family protein [Planctomycetota bacterium]
MNLTILRTTLCAPRGASAALGACLLLLQGAAAAQSDVADKLDVARPALEKWVETRRLLSKEERDWTLGRDMLTDTISVRRREIEALKAKIAEAEKSLAEADARRAELDARNAALKATAAAVELRVQAQETRLSALLKRLPETLKERVKPLTQRLPDPTKAAADSRPAPSLSERFRNVVGVVNEVNKFHRELTLSSEVRTIPGAPPAETATLYAGLARAWYAAPNGTTAGFGVPGSEGWIWTPAPEAADAIRRVVAILKNEQPAAFVRLPARIEK